MLLIVGSLIVFGSVLGGYLMHGGHLLVLNQPSEVVIICGAAVGSLLIGTPPRVIGQLLREFRGFFTGGTSKSDYVDLLSMLRALFRTVQQSGVMALEPHFEDPAQSPILSQYPSVLRRSTAVHFLADSVKIIMMGSVAPHDLEALMDQDLEVHHDEALKPAGTMTRLADALPGLGIVAAVLGVVITMQSIDGPPEEIGHKVAAALVGTFLGILLSYGLAQPLATSLEHRVGDEHRYLECIKSGLMAVYKGLPPTVAIEFARRAIPDPLRPSANELEQERERTEAAA